MWHDGHIPAKRDHSITVWQNRYTHIPSCPSNTRGNGEQAGRKNSSEERGAMTRAEHLQWAKDRALEYADQGDVGQAMASLGSDLNKHPETKGHSGMELMMMLAMGGHLDSPAELRKFIEGFN